MINKLVIVGVGLIGGSLARALRDGGHVREIVGVGRSLGNIQEAVRLGVIDYAEATPALAARDADLVVIAVPVGSIKGVLLELAPVLSARAVVTDVGSVKAPVVAAARAALGPLFANFVPGHPIAGTERSGVGAATPDLFRGRRVVLTPENETEASALALMQTLWTATGAHVSTMSAAQHDTVLAASSHLPHVLAFVLVDMLAQMNDRSAVFDCAGGGLRDVSRVAASDPTMWRDICLANDAAILKLLKSYQNDLAALARAIASGDGQRLLDTFSRAKSARDVHFIER